ncbi:hypothetical protein DH2020_027070 [Rehmannia glutinosa]|uniref:Uncharacterized protein n=1 Tax=Rehmannia glutinosa TaxID=99300 RepID=A0ABR0VV51_REHGL
MGNHRQLGRRGRARRSRGARSRREGRCRSTTTQLSQPEGSRDHRHQAEEEDENDPARVHDAAVDLFRLGCDPRIDPRRNAPPPHRAQGAVPDDMQQGRLGGGFSNYGSRPGSGGYNQGRPREYEGRRSYGFQDEDQRGAPSQPRVSEMNQSSRADEVDNWASMKKQTVPDYNSAQPRPGGKYSSLGGGGGPGVASRADDVDNWASAEPDRWTRNEQRLVSDSPKNEVEVVEKVNKPNPFGAARPREEVLAEKGLDWKKLDLDIEGKKQQHSVSGGSRPASSQSSRPESPLSSRSELTVGESAVKQKPKVNPFGDAKPREVLLEEKGLDWKKIDLELEHRRVERSQFMVSANRKWFMISVKCIIFIEMALAGNDSFGERLLPETEEEKNLKEEIEHLKKELLQRSDDDQTSIHDLIRQREQELELLVRQLDDKIRYSQKNFERQGSEVGKGAGFYERPPSRPGTYEEPRVGYSDRPRSRPGIPRSRPGAYEEPRGGSFPQRSSFMAGAYEETRGDYNERPRSRGTVNSWTRPSDDRGAIQGGGGRGFFGSRDVDRNNKGKSKKVPGKAVPPPQSPESGDGTEVVFSFGYLKLLPRRVQGGEFHGLTTVDS